MKDFQFHFHFFQIQNHKLFDHYFAKTRSKNDSLSVEISTPTRRFRKFRSILQPRAERKGLEKDGWKATGVASLARVCSVEFLWFIRSGRARFSETPGRNDDDEGWWTLRNMQTRATSPGASAVWIIRPRERIIVPDSAPRRKLIRDLQSRVQSESDERESLKRADEKILRRRLGARSGGKDRISTAPFFFPSPSSSLFLSSFSSRARRNVRAAVSVNSSDMAVSRARRKVNNRARSWDISLQITFHRSIAQFSRVFLFLLRI